MVFEKVYCWWRSLGFQMIAMNMDQNEGKCGGPEVIEETAVSLGQSEIEKGYNLG
jgi:hypothetical protein